MSMSHDDMIAVIQAHKEGKWLQFRLRDGGLYAPWKDTPDDPMFAFNVSDYRIKPEPTKPREFELGFCPSHGPRWVVAELPNRIGRQCIDCQVVHVREVLP